MAIELVILTKPSVVAAVALGAVVFRILLGERGEVRTRGLGFGQDLLGLGLRLHVGPRLVADQDVTGVVLRVRVAGVLLGHVHFAAFKGLQLLQEKLLAHGVVR
jgi:hypothetical protein